MSIVVCALYKFVTLDDFKSIKPGLLKVMKDNRVYGTLLLAQEGINGTIAGTQEAINQLLAWLKNDPRLAELEYKQSYTEAMPFKRRKVKLKKEIVTMGVAGVDPNHVVGTYVDARSWNNLINDPDVLVVDTRNDYEVQVGTFKNAINPNTGTFREFPQYVQDHLDPEQHKKVAMFCTGGIRCEKSTAYLKEQGFDEVFHLKGGILKYLEEVPQEESTWEGECFVFDDRVTVNHQLEQGQYHQCNACRLPITEQDQRSEHFEQGVSCPHCFNQHTPDQKQRFREREHQIQLARKRGEAHLGGAVTKTAQNRRKAKQTARKQQQALAAGKP